MHTLICHLDLCLYDLCRGTGRVNIRISSNGIQSVARVSINVETQIPLELDMTPTPSQYTNTRQHDCNRGTIFATCQLLDNPLNIYVTLFTSAGFCEPASPPVFSVISAEDVVLLIGEAVSGVTV